MIKDRTMPPRKAERGFGKTFQHDRSLAADDIATLAAWAEAGAPLGDPALLPRSSKAQPAAKAASAASRLS